MRAEGIVFRTNAHIGVNVPARSAAARLRRRRARWRAPASRAICRSPAASCAGIHFAMEYLTQQNRRCEGDGISDDGFITAAGKHVVIIGGGDTGADCLGTAHRQGARSVHQFELLPRPPETRAPRQPVADLAADLPCVDGARRRRRSGLLGLDAAVPR